MTTEDARPDHARGLLNQAMSHHLGGDFAQAQDFYRQALALDPRNFDALHLLGVVALQCGHPQHAAALISQALAIHAGSAQALANHGSALKALGEFDAAVASYDRSIALDPALAPTHHSRGATLLALMRLDDAIAAYDNAIAINPNYAEAHADRGTALLMQKRPQAAIASFDTAIALKPDFAGAYANRGNAFQELRQFDDAVASYDRAIAIDARYAEALFNRGNALLAAKRVAEAVDSYTSAVAVNPRYAAAYSNRGYAFDALGQFEDAIASYDQAIAIDPAYAEAHANRGGALLRLARFDEAIAACNAAIAQNPDHAQAHANMGAALQMQRQPEAALASYTKAVTLDPDHAEALANSGNVLWEMFQFDAAIASDSQAIAARPEWAPAYASRAHVHLARKQYQAAIADYEKALALAPTYTVLLGIAMHAKHWICDWSTYDADITALEDTLRRGARASTPFPALALLDSPALQAAVAATAINSARGILGPLTRRAYKDKIRLGYYSPDFRVHPVSHLGVGLFESHDRDKFEVIGFSFGPDTGDAMRARVAAAFDEFIDVRPMSDLDVTRLSRELEIDIAIDLVGLTQDGRPDIFAERAAPLQIGYLGYPASMSTDYFDYIIADAITIPAEARPHYREKVVILPHSYQVNDSKRAIADKTFTRVELGLPECGFVFCCFNNAYKIAPETFGGWMRILRQVEGSVLWLIEENSLATANLRNEAEKRGVDASRLIFASRMPTHADYLARYRTADLFLDTLPLNAHTLSSDALWAGLPVLTRMGQSFCGRVAGSLLHAIGLPELATTTQEDYEALAVDLATHPAKFAALRARLERNRLTTPLFDTLLSTRHLEAAYAAIYDRYHAGLPPDHIEIPA